MEIKGEYEERLNKALERVEQQAITLSRQLKDVAEKAHELRNGRQGFMPTYTYSQDYTDFVLALGELNYLRNRI